MTTETQVASDAATQINAAELAQTLEVAKPEAADGQAPQEEAKDESGDKPQLTPAEKEAAAKQRRIDRLTRTTYEMRAETNLLREQLERLQSRPVEQPDQTQETPLTQAEFDKRVTARAQEMVSNQTTGQRADAVEAKLKKSLGDGLKDFYGDVEAAGPAGKSLLRNAIELDEAADVLTYLGKNPDELDKVLELSPARQLAHMGKLAARIELEKTAPKRSSAPTPLTPVKGGSTSTEPPISDTKRWIEWSNAQDAIKRKR
ncbi:MAG: hypothetical protein HYX42_04050 [Polaromonas sp.]|uniref:hypothetical protein n=1 Tax=Polaromonas sp. TaxID=1869339 RepID=UPI0025EEA7BE|nr:hypothetical protein [Polaromonas sp.]MBI2725403.1 hypothetical protein [Polaromonas sp.]